jgi:hypothetical protein
MANGMTYGDSLGAPNQDAIVAAMKMRAIRFLFLALSAEGMAFGVVFSNLINKTTSRTLGLSIASGVATLMDGLTFALIRP